MEIQVLHFQQCLSKTPNLFSLVYNIPLKCMKEEIFLTIVSKSDRVSKKTVRDIACVCLTCVQGLAPSSVNSFLFIFFSKIEFNRVYNVSQINHINSY